MQQPYFNSNKGFMHGSICLQQNVRYKALKILDKILREEFGRIKKNVEIAASFRDESPISQICQEKANTV